MKRFSAQYIITVSGSLLRKGVISAEDDGTIISVEDTSGNLTEKSGTEFYNGIIIPGFVNCHCHLELSDLEGKMPPGQGLAGFIMNVRKLRDSDKALALSAAIRADDELYREGVVLCADICNTELTFEIKKESRIRYLNLLEVFGIDPGKAGKRIDEILNLSEKAASAGLDYSIVPHSVYSLSRELLRLVRKESERNKVTSIHFMESPGEERFLADQSGAIKESYKQSGLGLNGLDTVKDHVSAIFDYITSSGNLILVHNTFVSRDIIHRIKSRGNLFWCLCPGSNLFIENAVPPAGLLHEEGCDIVTGTDSLASNSRLSILGELKLLQRHFPGITLEELIRWSTLNGARALCCEDQYGSLEAGKKPGILLLEDADLQNMKLTPDTRIKRLL